MDHELYPGIGVVIRIKLLRLVGHVSRMYKHVPAQKAFEEILEGKRKNRMTKTSLERSSRRYLVGQICYPCFLRIQTITVVGDQKSK